MVSSVGNRDETRAHIAALRYRGHQHRWARALEMRGSSPRPDGDGRMPDQDIDFARIRPYGQPASRSGAFEELASILIRDGVVDWPAGTQFFRFGNPDGGREGKGVLPNGEVWAWQAKYLFEFDSAAAAQVSSSISRVLEN